jgi:hypothetical protein
MDRLGSTVLAAYLSLFIPGVAAAQSGVFSAGPDSLAQVSSLGDAIAKSENDPVHIIQIHGIGAEEAGDSLELRKKLCKAIGYCAVTPKVREYADQGLFLPSHPPGYQYMDAEVWADPKQWVASAPFVDHYVLTNKNGQVLIVDEINWWPIVFAIKCPNIMGPEAALSGLQKEYLDDCSRPIKQDRDGIHYESYNWLPERETATGRPGAPVNRSLKNSLVDWRFADAMIASGSMRNLFVEGVRQLLVKCAGFNPNGKQGDPHDTPVENWVQDKNQQFILITHSLGSYLALSTLDLDLPSRVGRKQMTPTQYIYEHTSLMYFFANQIPLLELSNIDFPPDGAGDGSEVQALGLNLDQRLGKWNDLRKNYLSKRSSPENCQLSPQIIAWSDPSDLLTYRVPKLPKAIVVNLYVVNAPHWLWTFEGPTAAHDRYVDNKHVLDTILRRTINGCD